MNEKQLGQALLDLDLSAAAGAFDPRQLTQKILSRDQRRVRRWTWMTIAVWLLAFLMVLWMFIAFALLFPMQAKLRQHAAVSSGGKPMEAAKLYSAESLSPADRQRLLADTDMAFQKLTVGVAGSVGVLGLATLCTVLLVLVSRRATLRQINASLLEISEQLKQLREPPRVITD